MKRLMFEEELKKGNFVPVPGLEGPENKYSAGYGRSRNKQIVEPRVMPAPVMSELKDDLWISLMSG